MITRDVTFLFLSLSSFFLFGFKKFIKRYNLSFWMLYVVKYSINKRQRFFP